jgi:hypothetical protein
VDLLIAADGQKIADQKVAQQAWSQRVYSIELKYGIPKNKDDAHKDIHHALTPGKIQLRYGNFNQDRGISIFILNAQDTTIVGLRSFEGQIERIATIAKEKYANWTLLRNSRHSSPNFMVVAVVPLDTAGLQLLHCRNGTAERNPKWNELLRYDQPQLNRVEFMTIDD